MKRRNIFPIFIISILLMIGFWTPTFSNQTAQLHAQDLQDDQAYFFPIFINNYQSQPLFSTSYYLITVDGTFLFDLGCDLGKRDQNLDGAQDSVVILNFSFPVCDNDEGCFGADLYGFGPVSTEDIGLAVRNFAWGYYTCTGSDHESNLVIGMGTNNKFNSCETEAQMTAHGAAWAQTVKDINQWAADQGIFHQVQVYGASNIELGWNTPTLSRAWITGFEQVGGNFLLNFGDAAGCPSEVYPHWSCGTSSYREWTLEDVWHVSYGAPSALPLPLIFRTDGLNAKQWAYLSQYSTDQHGYRMDFTGVLTQKQACEQRAWSCRDKGIDNTPYEAYWQLTSALNKFTDTAQDMRWKTDIRWTVAAEIPPSGSSLQPSQVRDNVHPVQDEITKLQLTLKNSNLSAVLKNSLEEKLKIYKTIALRITESIQNPAPKDSEFSMMVKTSSDPKFRTGIFTNGVILGLPDMVIINNTWQTETKNGFIQVAAGAAPDNPGEGALYLMYTSLNKTGMNPAILLAPAGSGSLTIMEENEAGLLIQSENGSTFVLDLKKQSLSPLGN